MEIFKRTLLAIELIILCGPAIFIIFFGLLFSPLILLDATSRFDFVFVLIYFGGIWGFFSLANLTLHVFRKKHWEGRGMQWIGILFGITACILGLITMKKASLLWVFTGPIIAGLHLLYLSKKYSHEKF